MKKCVILAAGDFPTAPEPLKALREADYVCCCDSAAKALTTGWPTTACTTP